MRIQVSSGRTNFGQASVEFNTGLCCKCTLAFGV